MYEFHRTRLRGDFVVERSRRTQNSGDLGAFYVGVGERFGSSYPFAQTSEQGFEDFAFMVIGKRNRF